MDNLNDGKPHCTLDELDEISVLRLELMDELIESKKEMENSLREGYFLLGKARYIMGSQSVSMLQIPSTECDFESRYHISVSQKNIDEIPSLSSHEFSIVHSAKNLTSNVKKENTNLRKRGTQSEDIKDSEEIDNENCKKNDPLTWFSALPPQSLRKAQQHFRQAVLHSTHCATIQSKLNALNQKG